MTENNCSSKIVALRKFAQSVRDHEGNPFAVSAHIALEILARLEEETLALSTDLADVRQGYDRLDLNWSRLHNGGIDAFRTALEMPDASIPEMLSAIEHLRRPKDQVMHVFWDEESTYVVARTCEDAALVYADAIGEGVTFDSLEWSLFPGDQPLRIKCYGSDHPGTGTIAPVDEEGPHIVLVTRPAIEWAHRCGRGFLCTTDY